MLYFRVAAIQASSSSSRLTSQEHFLISFQSSFQSSGLVSVEEWAEYTEKIPSTQELTSCHWMLQRYFTNNMGNIWAYCYMEDGNDNARCTQFYIRLLKETANRHVKAHTWFNHDIFIPSGKMASFRQREWNYICLTFSLATGVGRVYLNGKMVSEKMVETRDRLIR